MIERKEKRNIIPRVTIDECRYLNAKVLLYLFILTGLFRNQERNLLQKVFIVTKQKTDHIFRLLITAVIIGTSEITTRLVYTLFEYPIQGKISLCYRGLLGKFSSKLSGLY